MANVKYFLWLTTRSEFKTAELNLLLEHFGSPEAIFFAAPEEYRLLNLSAAKCRTLEDKDLRPAERILEDCDREGIRILTIQDAGYPERLKQIYDPPVVLYLKGKDLTIDDTITVGVVGTRRCTPYGQNLAGRLGLELARSGVTLVSGIAEGIDAAGIRGALQGRGSPICVLGGGIDVIYPRQHRDLYADVAAVGTLVSEYPPGTRPEGFHFPVRNRILSGLSLGVVVAEAGQPSGALITARLALDQNREVFAFPGPVHAWASLGTNRLIQKGEAKLILSAADVLEELLLQTAVPMEVSRHLSDAETDQRLESTRVPIGGKERKKTEQKKQNEPATEEKVVDKEPQRAYISLSDDPEALTEDERDILTALQDRCLTADELVEETQIPTRRVLSTLTLLQIAERAEERPGKRFTATVILKP